MMRVILVRMRMHAGACSARDRVLVLRPSLLKSHASWQKNKCVFACFKFYALTHGQRTILWSTRYVGFGGPVVSRTYVVPSIIWVKMCLVTKQLNINCLKLTVHFRRHG
jgi:hypothetical protein